MILHGDRKPLLPSTCGVPTVLREVELQAARRAATANKQGSLVEPVTPVAGTRPGPSAGSANAAAFMSSTVGAGLFTSAPMLGNTTAATGKDQGKSEVTHTLCV